MISLKNILPIILFICIGNITCGSTICKDDDCFTCELKLPMPTMIYQWLSTPIHRELGIIELAAVCQRELGRFKLENQFKCLKSSRLMFKVLDCKASYGISCFNEELEDLITQKQIHIYLKMLLKALQRKNDLNLWEWTLKFVKNDKTKALKWIAVLFQDSNTQAHLKIFKENPIILLLRQVMSYIKYDNKINKNLSLYPKGISIENDSLYHFYTIAYISQKMSKAHNSNNKNDQDKMAFLMPYLLDRTYEFYTHKIGAFANIFSERSMKSTEVFLTPSINNIKNLKHVKDIYLGFTGSLFGLNLKNKHFTFVDFDIFEKHYTKDPIQYIKKIIEE